MKDIIIKLYELNEHYHDTKEKMAWLASSLYAAFSVAIITWLFSKEIYKIHILKLNSIINIILFFIIIVVVFICAILFICFQYKKKKISAVITDKYEKIILNEGLNYKNKLRRMFDYKSDVHNNWKKYRKDYKNKKLGRSEIPIKIMIFIFFIAQIISII